MDAKIETLSQTPEFALAWSLTWAQAHVVNKVREILVQAAEDTEMSSWLMDNRDRLPMWATRLAEGHTFPFGALAHRAGPDAPTVAVYGTTDSISVFLSEIEALEEWARILISRAERNWFLADHHPIPKVFGRKAEKVKAADMRRLARQASTQSREVLDATTAALCVYRKVRAAVPASALA